MAICRLLCGTGDGDGALFACRAWLRCLTVPAGQKNSDGDGRDEQARASDTLAKSYRYLRLAMVGLLACLAAAVGYQSWRQGDLLGSVSAYYYTPAQAFFVGGLIGLGACMIALKGTTPVEDLFLNLGGVFAAIVALVPTGRDADYRAAVRACREAGTPLLTQKASTGRLDCPTVQVLEATTKANVDNNLAALLFVGAIVLVAAFVVARKDGPLKREADGDAVRRPPGEVTRQSLNAVGDTVRELTALQRRDWYNWAPRDAGGRRGDVRAVGARPHHALLGRSCRVSVLHGLLDGADLRARAVDEVRRRAAAALEEGFCVGIRGGSGSVAGRIHCSLEVPRMGH